MNSLFSDYEAVRTNNSTKLGTTTTKNFYSTSCILIHPQFITGVSDAEASFFITFVKSNKYSLGYSVQLSYQITLHKRDKVLLELIKSYFGVGSIHMKNTREVMVYQVTSIKDLTAIVSHFNKFPLNTNKRADYELFQMGFKLINQKEHLNTEGLLKILSIKASLNKGLSSQLKTDFPNITSNMRPDILIQPIKSPQ